MGQQNGLKRRTVLTSIAGSVGTVTVGSSSVIASKPTSDRLSVERSLFSELAFEAEIDGSDIPTPPSVTCRRNLLTLDEDMRACVPAHVTVRSGTQLLNTHEGAKLPETTSEPMFREIPLEATAQGQQVAIPGSQAPSFDITRRSGDVVVSIDDTEFSVEEGGDLEDQVIVDSGLENVGDLTVQFVLNDLGEVEVLSHPTKSVVPANSKAAKHYESIAARAEGRGNGNGRNDRDPNVSSKGGPPAGVPRGVRVTEVREENVLLIDHSNGGASR